jgi:hypothetical protein
LVSAPRSRPQRRRSSTFSSLCSVIPSGALFSVESRACPERVRPLRTSRTGICCCFSHSTQREPGAPGLAFETWESTSFNPSSCVIQRGPFQALPGRETIPRGRNPNPPRHSNATLHVANQNLTREIPRKCSPLTRGAFIRTNFARLSKA